MSNTTMQTAQITSKSRPKARLSIALDFEKKQALQTIAENQNRSVHFVMLDMIEKGLQEAREEAEYQAYIKNRVMKAYNRLETEGSKGVTSSELKKRVMKNLDERLKGNQ